jgi:hypothetical protein
VVSLYSGPTQKGARSVWVDGAAVTHVVVYDRLCSRRDGSLRREWDGVLKHREAGLPGLVFLVFWRNVCEVDPAVLGCLPRCEVNVGGGGELGFRKLVSGEWGLGEGYGGWRCCRSWGY